MSAATDVDRRVRCGLTSDLQSGQSDCLVSHLERHSTWKECEHGRTKRSPATLLPPGHTAHSSSAPPRDEDVQSTRARFISAAESPGVWGSWETTMSSFERGNSRAGPGPAAAG